MKTNNSIIFAIILFSFFNNNLLYSQGGKWRVIDTLRFIADVQNGTNIYYDTDFIDIKSCDEKNICILANIVFKVPIIYKSTNGGSSWELLKDTIHLNDGVGNMKKAKSLAYPNKNTIIISCDSGYYWRSTDAGKTWDYKQTKFKLGFHNITFLDSNTAIATQYSYQDQLIKTTDAGKTWNLMQYYRHSDSSGITQIFYFKPNKLIYVEAVEFYNGLYCIASSNDLGANWNYEYFKTDYRFYFNFINENIGFNSGADATISHKVINKTTDAGKTWRTVLDTTMPPGYGVYDISFYDSLHGVANGVWQIWKTNDGGEHWFEDTTYNYKRDPIRSVGLVKYISKDRIVAFSTHGWDLVYLNDMSKTDIAEETIKVTSQKIFPNPISSGSKLQIQGIEFIEDVNLYDLSGISTKLEANSNEIRIPYALLPGFYVLQYRAGGLVYREKIIIIE